MRARVQKMVRSAECGVRCSDFPPTKVGAQVLVINYGLKSVAWFGFATPITIHATGFSQWLMTDFFLSAEFIRR
jgi:hypothetical protein